MREAIDVPNIELRIMAQVLRRIGSHAVRENPQSRVLWLLCALCCAGGDAIRF